MQKASTIILFVLTLSVVASAEIYQAQKFPLGTDNTQRCLKCHGMHDFTYLDSSKKTIDLTVDSTTFCSSVHGKLQCQSCHPGITEYPHNLLTAGRTTCATECHASKDGKPYNHRGVYDAFLHSVHGEGLTGKDPDAPTCLTCHGGDAHVIQPVEKVMTAQEKMALCISCHDNRELMVKHDVNPGAVASYKKSFHWKAILYGYDKAAVCENCHTNHSVLAPDNPNSTVNAANLPKTCGQTNCHPGAKMDFASSGANHLTWAIGEYKGLRYEVWFYYLVIGGTVSALLLGVVLDVQRRVGFPRIAHDLAVDFSRSLKMTAKLGVRIWKFMVFILIK